MQNYNPPPKPKRSPRPQNTDSFLEALRDLGSSSFKSVGDQTKDFAQEAWKQLTGKFPSGDASDFSVPQFPDPETESFYETKNKKGVFFERQRSTYEKVVYSKADQQTKLQIQSLQEELKKLASSTQNLTREMQVATLQAPANPGIYHVGFFEKLKSTIIAIKKRVDESASWLSTLNSKGKKQDFYWSQVGKSGTKYMLSQERYMSNSAG